MKQMKHAQGDDPLLMLNFEEEFYSLGEEFYSLGEEFYSLGEEEEDENDREVLSQTAD